MVHPMSSIHKLVDLWSERPAVDWATAVALVSLHGIYCRLSQHGGVFETISVDQRANIYMTAASIAALVGGFGTAAISQYATATGRRMQVLRRRFGLSLRKNWSGILKSMLIVAGGCLAALIIDDRKHPGWIGWAVEFLLIFGALRSLRLVWIFNLLIDIADQDGTESRSPAIRLQNISGDGDVSRRTPPLE